LGKDALACQYLGGEADYEAEHGHTAIPGFSEGNETKAESGVGHGWNGWFQQLQQLVTRLGEAFSLLGLPSSGMEE
jgi:hypothetical protein